MTLPLIYTLNTVSKKDKRWLINSVKRHNRDKKRVREVIQFVKDHGGLDYAVKSMYDYKNRALDILNTYPDSEFKSSLLMMVDYVIDREK
jgi:octaprenyl-diphosphate synthase